MGSSQAMFWSPPTNLEISRGCFWIALLFKNNHVRSPSLTRCSASFFIKPRLHEQFFVCDFVAKNSAHWISRVFFLQFFQLSHHLFEGWLHMRFSPRAGDVTIGGQIQLHWTVINYYKLNSILRLHYGFITTASWEKIYSVISGVAKRWSQHRIYIFSRLAVIIKP